MSIVSAKIPPKLDIRPLTKNIEVAVRMRPILQ